MHDNLTVNTKNPAYVGRFAPSPSGPLHFGSLVCALASYLDAKKAGGRWLLRIEDIDPPRSLPGAETMIIQSLNAHGFEWDGEILYQSKRSQVFDAIIGSLKELQVAYYCDCSRKRLHSLNQIYDGLCREKRAQSGPCALRLKVTGLVKPLQEMANHQIFNDIIQGTIEEHVSEQGDFIIHRKDGLYAYQLAVVVDDIYQGITHVIRGYDLIDSTARQIFMFKLLGYSAPVFGHIPVITGADGCKLSKQAFAPAINDKTPSINLFKALRALKMSPPNDMLEASPSALLQWGIQHWSCSPLQHKHAICENNIVL